jgi:ribosomal-protein-alanine N-acetyltransferase
MLRGVNIAIRPVKEADLDQLISAINELDSVGAFLPNVWQSEPGFRSEFEGTGFLTPSFSRFAIVNPSDQVIGLTWSFKSVPYFDAFEIGYRIFDQEDTGKGYASEALKLLCKYLFEAFQVNRLEVRVAAGNDGSEKVAQKCGFNLEGTHREAAYSKGKLYDMHCYALLRREWAANKQMQPTAESVG